MADDPGEEDCSRLIEDALAAAKRLLEEEGQFRPFALTLSPTGETEILVPQSDGDTGTSEDDLEALRADLGAQADAGDITAASIAINAWLNADDPAEKSDAVIVFAEHSGGLALQANQLYAIEERRGDVVPGHAVTWNDLTVDVIEPSIFAAS
ncbi:MAG: hypothetical protein ACREIP_14455 [Alphaproteobacteria bacterium]